MSQLTNFGPRGFDGMTMLALMHQSAPANPVFRSDVHGGNIKKCFLDWSESWLDSEGIIPDSRICLRSWVAYGLGIRVSSYRWRTRWGTKHLSRLPETQGRMRSHLYRPGETLSAGEHWDSRTVSEIMRGEDFRLGGRVSISQAAVRMEEAFLDKRLVFSIAPETSLVSYRKALEKRIFNLCPGLSEF